MPRMNSTAPADCLYAVAIPAKNERQHIGRCLQALNTQPKHLLNNLTVVLLVNNSCDQTAEIAHDLSPSLGYRLCVELQQFPLHLASAGTARRAALDQAYLRLADKEGGVLLTTDADSAVPSNWLEMNIRALAHGADAVAGDVEYVLDVASPNDPICVTKQLETAYEAILAEIEARLDPRAHNPWPRHRTESGASLAMWGSTYLRARGLPTIDVGEDRAFCARIEAEGLALRHAPEVKVRTSVRLDGRAEGGAATFLRNRHLQGNDLCDTRMIPIDRAAIRAHYQRVYRRRYKAASLTAEHLQSHLHLSPETAAEILSLPSFSEFWASLIMRSPVLRAAPLRLTDLLPQLRQGQQFVRYLRECESLRRLVAKDLTDIGQSSLASAPRRHFQAAE